MRGNVVVGHTVARRSAGGDPRSPQRLHVGGGGDTESACHPRRADGSNGDADGS